MFFIFSVFTDLYLAMKTVQVTSKRSKVKSRSHHNIAHLDPNQCLYQVSTFCSIQFLRYSQKIYLRSGALQQGQRSNQDHTMMLRMDTPQPISLPNINFLRLKVSKILPRQDFKAQGHYNKAKDQIKVTTRCCTYTPPTRCF